MTPLPLVVIGSATVGLVIAVAWLVFVANDRRWVLHNVLAHPLLVLCPPLGEWLHDRTAPDDDLLTPLACSPWSTSPPGIAATRGRLGTQAAGSDDSAAAPTS